MCEVRPRRRFSGKVPTTIDCTKVTLYEALAATANHECRGTADAVRERWSKQGADEYGLVEGAVFV
jgi:hypothetical protein